MISCAAAAIIVAAGAAPRPVNAQAFQGTPTLPNPNIAVAGSASRNITSGTTETITVGTPTATINWTPFDNDSSGPIDFLPAGNVATFTNDPNTTTDFTVLNRIVPLDASRPILLNGTVISQLQDLSSNTTTGGHVWFYSPGGIVVGASAVFNVGGLLLTANDPLTFSQTANGFTGNFASATDSTANVTITNGAQITASGNNSYVALVAPRVVQNGNVNVDGSAAYVAGEDVTLTMNQGLFDIAVDVGTTDSNGIDHQGTTGGPASTGAAGDNHRIYMVAVPKNQALTMLLSGNAGFTPASSVTLDNGTIVLAAGSNVAETSGTLVVTSPNGINADLTIGTGNYTSDVRAFARGDIDVTADNGFISFARDVSLMSLLAGETGRVSVGASGGYILDIGRNLTMQTNGANFTAGAPEELNITIDGGTVNVGGNLNMFAGAAADGTQSDVEIVVRDQSENHGSLNVTGQTLINASASGSSPPSDPAAESALSRAGNISIGASNGGAITLHDTTLFASANGQDNDGNGNGFAGSGIGGNINVTANGGTIDITGNLFAGADGFGGNLVGGGSVAGAGFGGDIFLGSNLGNLAITGNMFLSALGGGGDYLSGVAPGQGGFGEGGFIQVFNGGPSTITVGGTSTLRSDGVGGDGQTGGNGFGGTAGIYGYNGTIALGPTIDVSAQGRGGNANAGFGGNGGRGSGGYAFINANAIPPGVEQFASAATITGGNATIDASGFGGSGGAGNGDNIVAGAGGDGFGGQQCQGDCSPGGASAVAQVDGASLTLGNVTLLANGLGGTGGTGGGGQSGGAGGRGFGGGVLIGLVDSSFSPTGAADGEAHYSDVLGFASGTGGNGGAGGTGGGQGDGGLGQGGTASLWSNSLVTASSVTFFANGNGGDGANGGDAFGGWASITSNDAFIDIDGTLTRVDGLIDIAGDVTLEAAAATGNGSTGTSGNASGGTAELRADGGDVTVGGDVFLSADGDAETGVTGGLGEGGLATVDAYDGAILMAANIAVEALGEGGNGSISAGNGEGGTARVRGHSGASIITDGLTADATGTGGNSVDGGSGFGGLAEASAFEQDSKLTVTGLATVRANGTGGSGTAGGTGGTGFGGTANLYAGVGDSGTGGATVTINNAVVRAQGRGGAGGIGGSGFGGGDPAETEGVQIGARLGTLTFTGTLFVDAGGVGGAGLNGVGGDGFGGNILVGANFVDDVGPATLNLGTTDLWAVGVGGNGGGSGNGGGNGFGGEVGVGASTGGSTITATALSLHAGANGGVGGNGAIGGRGGDANGGHALIDIAAGSANLGVTQSFARGVAGTGGTGSSGAGGAGGDGFAGLVELNVSGILTGTSYQGHAQANGGDGGTGTTQGAGGSAEGGSAYFNVNLGGEATLSAGVLLDASALRGNGSTLGNAIGGLADLFVAGSFSAGAFTAAANGSDAGDIFVTVADGGSADLGVAQLSVQGAPGTGTITIDLGAPLVLGGFGIGTFGLNNIVLTADSLSLVTSGDIDILSAGGASIDVAGTFSANAGGAMTLDDIDGTAVARADVIDFDANSFSSTFDILGRVIDISTVLDLDVTGTVLIADETLALTSQADILAGDLSAGLLINLNAGNNITAGNLDSGGDILADAGGDIQSGNLTAVGKVDLNASGDIAFGNVDADILDFSADGTVTGGNILAKRKATGDAEGAIVLGNITVGPGPELPGDFSIGIASATSVTVGDVNSFGRVGFATLGDLIVGDVVAGPLFLTLVGGDVTVGSITTDTSGRVYMADVSMFLANGGTDDFDPAPVLAAAPVATGGSILISGPVSTGVFEAAAGGDFDSADITAGQTIAITAGGDVATLDLDAGQTVTLNAGTGFGVDDVDAGTSATFTTGGVATFFGTVSSPTITITSGDIDIFGQLGVFGVTNLVTLNAQSDSTPILIGGEQGAAAAAALVPGLQYWLANNEVIQSNSIVFNAEGVGEGPTPNVIVSDFDIAGSQTAGGGVHNFELNTDGAVLVNGVLAYSAAGASDLLAINAGDVQVDTSAGGRIAMTDPSNAPSGILELTAENIWVGDETLLGNLNTDPNFAGRDDMVGTNSGDVVPEGWLIAGGMTLGIGNTLFVQNSGSGTTFAGISVGAGGLTINTTGEAPAQVVAYGRKVNANGTFTTGNAFFNLVDFGLGGGSIYTDLSEFNECLINTGCIVGGGVGGPGPEDILGPIDLLSDPQETTEGNDDGPGGSQGSRSELIDVGALSEDELIDEGVTSGGDNNQWDGVCREDPSDPRCPAADGTKKEPAK